MTSLRIRQKAERHQRMVDAAAQLFRAIGYDNTSIEAIADLAGVSAATVYNYYSTKAEILLAIVALEGEKVHALGQAILSGTAPPWKCLDELVTLYMEHPMKFMGKEDWRQAMAMSILYPGIQFGRQYAEVEHRLCKQIVEALKQFVSQGRMGDKTDCETLGRIIFDTTNGMFMELLCDEAMTLEDANIRLRNHVDCIIGPWLDPRAL